VWDECGRKRREAMVHHRKMEALQVWHVAWNMERLR
jgi:hypothetical protein